MIKITDTKRIILVGCKKIFNFEFNLPDNFSSGYAILANSIFNVGQSDRQNLLLIDLIGKKKCTIGLI